jgi:hypothetical protein
MQRSIPQYLYKYRSVDANSLAMLASDKVYLSRLDAFNDPFEVLNLSPTLETKIAPQPYGAFAVAEAPAQTGTVATSLRACSLSEESQDLLMWGHYADRHCGFCIRFEFAKDEELSRLLYPVDYNRVGTGIGAHSDKCPDHVLRAILTKSEKWSYEREWRIVGQAPNDESETADLFAAYTPDAITGIIFGVRTPELHKALIRKVLQDHRLEYFQAEKQNDNFLLTIRPLPANHGN